MILDIFVNSYPVDEYKLGNSRAGVQHFTEGVHDFAAVQFLHHFFKPTIYGTFRENTQAFVAVNYCWLIE